MRIYIYIYIYVYVCVRASISNPFVHVYAHTRPSHETAQQNNIWWWKYVYMYKPSWGCKFSTIICFTTPKRQSPPCPAEEIINQHPYEFHWFKNLTWQKFNANELQTWYPRDAKFGNVWAQSTHPNQTKSNHISSARRNVTALTMATKIEFTWKSIGEQT